MDVSELTSRQLQVLHCVGKGMTNDEIVLSLGINAGTVNDHIDAIRQRTGLQHRTQLIIAYVDEHFGSELLPLEAGERAAIRLATSACPLIKPATVSVMIDAFVQLWLEHTWLECIRLSCNVKSQAPEVADAAARLGISPHTLKIRLYRMRRAPAFANLRTHQLVYMAYLARKYEDHLQGEEQ